MLTAKSSFLVMMTAEKLGTFTPVLNPSSPGFCFNLSYLLQRSPESWALIHPLTEYLYFVPKWQPHPRFISWSSMAATQKAKKEKHSHPDIHKKKPPDFVVFPTVSFGSRFAVMTHNTATHTASKGENYTGFTFADGEIWYLAFASKTWINIREYFVSQYLTRYKQDLWITER